MNCRAARRSGGRFCAFGLSAASNVSDSDTFPAPAACGRTPAREAAAPRTPAPARRSTCCGSRWALAPPPAAPCPGPRPNPPGGPGRPGGPLRATVSPGTASGSSGPGLRPALPAVLDALAAAAARGRIPAGRQPRPGRWHRPGDPHAAGHGGPWHRLRQLRALGHGPTSGDPGHPDGRTSRQKGNRPGRQPHPGRRHRAGDPHAAGHGGPLPPPPAASGPGTRPDLPAILDALAARCGSREDTTQGAAAPRTPPPARRSTRCGPQRAPGTTPGSFGPWDTARPPGGPGRPDGPHQLTEGRRPGRRPRWALALSPAASGPWTTARPRRRSWTPWRPAAARGRIPGQGGNRTPEAATGPKIHTLRATWALPPPPAAPAPGSRPSPPGDPGRPGGPHQLAGGHRPGRQPHHGRRHRPEIHALRLTVGPGTASGGSGPWITAQPSGDPGRPGGPHQPAGGHRPGRQPHHGRRHRPGDPHAAAHGGPWHRLRQLRALEHGQTPPEILGPLAARTSWQEGTAQGDSRTTDAGTGPEIHTLRATAGHGTAPRQAPCPGPRPDPAGDPGRPGGPHQLAGGHRPGRQPHPGRRHRPGDLHAAARGGPLAPPPAAPCPGPRPAPSGDPGRPGGPHQLAGGHRPGRRPRHGRRHRPGDLHAAARGGPLAPPPAAPAPGPRPALPAILDTLAVSASRRENAARAAAAPRTPATARRSTRCDSRWAPATVSGSSGPGTTASPPGDPGHPDGPHQPAGGRRPGKQPRHGRRQRPGDPHAAAIVGAGTASGSSGPWNTARPCRRSWTP